MGLRKVAVERKFEVAGVSVDGVVERPTALFGSREQANTGRQRTRWLAG